MDTHCLVTADRGTACGCVREAALTGNVLRVSLTSDALENPRPADGETESAIEAPAEDVIRFREVLARQTLTTAHTRRRGQGSHGP